MSLSRDGLSGAAPRDGGLIAPVASPFMRARAALQGRLAAQNLLELLLVLLLVDELAA